MKDGKHVILCIDDDQDVRQSLRAVLESAGYAVVDAPDGNEGLRKLKSEQPDLVIVDLMMEEIDAGTQFVRSAKATGVDIPMFMLSSVGDDLNANVSYTDLGLTGILQKPIAPARLLSTLEKTLSD